MRLKQLSLFPIEVHDDFSSVESVPPYSCCFVKSIWHVFKIPSEDISKKSFVFGENVIEPGMILKKIGSSSRSEIDIGKPLIYDGRIGRYILFKVDEEWPIPYHIVFFQISEESLQMPCSPVASRDIVP